MFTYLQSFWYFYSHFTIWMSNSHLTSQYCIIDADVCIIQHIVRISSSFFRLFDQDSDIQITCRSSQYTCVSFAGISYLGFGFDSCRNLYRQGCRLLFESPTCYLYVIFIVFLACSLTLRTCCLCLHNAKHRACLLHHYATSITCCT
jgi:hypothetical protein